MCQRVCRSADSQQSTSARTSIALGGTSYKSTQIDKWGIQRQRDRLITGGRGRKRIWRLRIEKDREVNCGEEFLFLTRLVWMGVCFQAFHQMIGI